MVWTMSIPVWPVLMIGVGSVEIKSIDRSLVRSIGAGSQPIDRSIDRGRRHSDAVHGSRIDAAAPWLLVCQRRTSPPHTPASPSGRSHSPICNACMEGWIELCELHMGRIVVLRYMYRKAACDKILTFMDMRRAVSAANGMFTSQPVCWCVGVDGECMNRSRATSHPKPLPASWLTHPIRRTGQRRRERAR